MNRQKLLSAWNKKVSVSTWTLIFIALAITEVVLNRYGFYKSGTFSADVASGQPGAVADAIFLFFTAYLSVLHGDNASLSTDLRATLLSITKFIRVVWPVAIFFSDAGMLWPLLAGYALLFYQSNWLKYYQTRDPLKQRLREMMK